MTSLHHPIETFPHTEGGRHPLGRFSASLAGHGEATLERFYSTNFASLFAPFRA
jgi:hypothetical protein